MPAEWSEMSVENLRLPHAALAFTLHHDQAGVDLDVHNSGEPAAVDFSPEIPLGAEVVGAQCDGAGVNAGVVAHAQDAHAQLQLTAARGESHCRLRLAGGVSVVLASPAAQIGDASSGMRLTRLHLQGRELTLDADVHAPGVDHFRLQTPWRIKSISGASYKALPHDAYEVRLLQRSNPRPADGYASAHVGISFEDP
jgi:hypothetical protein